MSGGGQGAEALLDEADQAEARDSLLRPAPHERQSRVAAAALPLHRQLVRLRAADLQHLGGLHNGHERRQIIEHRRLPTSTAWRSAPRQYRSMRATMLAKSSNV